MRISLHRWLLITTNVFILAILINCEKQAFKEDRSLVISEEKWKNIAHPIEINTDLEELNDSIKLNEDDELDESKLVSAAIESLSEWSKKKKRRVKRDEEVVCYGELGCFRDEGPFDYLDMLPSTPEEISTKFHLFTRSNLHIPNTFSYFNYTTSIKNSSFNSSAPTKVIIHGFGSTCSKIWANEMRLTLLSVVECNVFCVDWENGAKLPNYVRAAVNTRLVGKQVALFISWLNENLGSKPTDFHLIGFSLGAHVAGFAGQEVKNLSRITGLDPAGPLYESYDKKVRLDSTDALFVDVIHSNGDSLLMGGLGSWEPMGHVDFYPNGGRVQKGCSNLFLGAVRDFLWSGSEGDGRSLCNHRRAYKFFTESISPRCPFPAFSCESYDKFISGSCFTWDTTRCGNMGYFADRLPNPKQGLLYLITREDEPFCANQYKISLESSPSTAPISTYGGIEIILIGHDLLNETFVITRSMKDNMLPGSIIQRILVAHPAIIDPIQIQLKYTAYQGWLYTGIARWSMDSLILTNAYGKSVSFCTRLQLPSGIAVTVRLAVGNCRNQNRFTIRPSPAFPGNFPPPITGEIISNNVGNVDSTNGNITEIESNDLSVMKPPAINHLIHQPVIEQLELGAPPQNEPNYYIEKIPIGPLYQIPNQQWSWRPLTNIKPTQKYQYNKNNGGIGNNSETQGLIPFRPVVMKQDHHSSEQDDEIPKKLRICLLNNPSEFKENNGTVHLDQKISEVMPNVSCIVQSFEVTDTIEDDHEIPNVTEQEHINSSNEDDSMMSNRVLGQIASYHEEMLKEDQLFHNNVEDDIEQDISTTTEGGERTVTSTTASSGINNGTFFSTTTLKNVNGQSESTNQQIPPHLSYILRQLESEGLGPDPSIWSKDRLSSKYHEESSNYLRAIQLIDHIDIPKLNTHPKTTRLIPSSRALKMRPVTLNSQLQQSASSTLNIPKRQSKIMDLNYVQPSSSPDRISHISYRTGMFLNSRIPPSIQWIHPPPPPSSSNILMTGPIIGSLGSKLGNNNNIGISQYPLGSYHVTKSNYPHLTISQNIQLPLSPSTNPYFLLNQSSSSLRRRLNHRPKSIFDSINKNQGSNTRMEIHQPSSQQRLQIPKSFLDEFRQWSSNG